MTSSSNTIPNSKLRFQLILDSENVVLSLSPDEKIRANITGLEADQLENIIDCIVDAGPEAVEQFKRLMNKKLVQPSPEVAEL